MTDSVPPSRDTRRLTAILSLAFVVRCAVIWLRADQLTIDRDAYLGIAESLSHGIGFCTPETTSPTAFRPPLYPLLLAASLAVFPPALAVAAWNILAGVGTAWLVERLGSTLGLGAFRHLAALLVALDPLLLHATTQPMTEVVFTALVAAWLWAVICVPITQPAWGNSVLIALLFGLATLCRPTLWPLAGLMAIRWMICQRYHLKLPASTSSPLAPAAGERVRERGDSLPTTPNSVDPSRSTMAGPGLRRNLRSVLPMLAGVLLVVAPWVVRNQIVFGRPILTTTHGGYTLLLANNPVHDAEVVRQPWGTVWSGDSLARWQAEVDRRAAIELGPNTSELQRDAWMAAEAKQHIRQNPSDFAWAVLHRVRSLWSLAPRGEGSSLPAVVRQGVALFYAAEFLLAALGLMQIVRRREWPRWLPCLLLIVTIQAVHLVYWTDARMRTPLEPVLTLLAARGLTRSERTGDA